MSDDNTIATVVAQPEPIKPGASAGLSVGNTILIVLAGVSTIWTCFQKGGLTEVYNYLNSIPGAPFLSILALGAAAGWRAFKKWRRDKLLAQQHAVIQQQHEIIDTIANAPPLEAAETVAALRSATPVATPIPVTETKP